MNKYAFIFLFGILLGIFVIYFYLELFTGRSELESGEHDSAGSHKRGQNTSTILIFSEANNTTTYDWLECQPSVINKLHVFTFPLRWRRAGGGGYSEWPSN